MKVGHGSTDLGQTWWEDEKEVSPFVRRQEHIKVRNGRALPGPRIAHMSPSANDLVFCSSGAPSSQSLSLDDATLSATIGG